MKTWIRGLGASAGALAVVALALAVTVDRVAVSRANRAFDTGVCRAVAVPADAGRIERGRYLFASRGCADCHGQDGAGRTFVDDGGLRAHAPNLTRGSGSAVAAYADADWDCSIRHGIAPGGRALMMMPSEDYDRLTDADLGALVAYLRQLPAVEGSAGSVEMPWPLKALFAAGRWPLAAEKIDHQRPPAEPVPEGVTVEHGAYVAAACRGCHGEDLSGGPIAGAPPAWPPASNLTPGEAGLLERYARLEDFAAMLRTGRRPDGSPVSEAMPFGALSAMNATDVGALHLYLNSLPPRASGRH